MVDPDIKNSNFLRNLASRLRTLIDDPAPTRADAWERLDLFDIDRLNSIADSIVANKEDDRVAKLRSSLKDGDGGPTMKMFVIPNEAISEIGSHQPERRADAVYPSTNSVDLSALSPSIMSRFAPDAPTPSSDFAPGLGDQDCSPLYLISRRSGVDLGVIYRLAGNYQQLEKSIRDEKTVHLFDPYYELSYLGVDTIVQHKVVKAVHDQVVAFIDRQEGNHRSAAHH